VECLRKLAEKWPSTIVARSEVSKFSGGLLTPGTLANLDSQKLGPPKFKVGRKVAYPLDELIKWIENRIDEEA